MAHFANASASSSISTTAPSKTNRRYEVFLNHRGEDVKKTFASHLYRRLRLHGFQVFLDQQEMQPGDGLTSQITGAIATACVHIAIFSPNYAKSKWCLEELVLMLESMESGATVIPVFYHVHPSVLRWTGDDSRYGQALRNLEEKKRHDPNTIKIWKRALFDAAGISGLELEACNWDEGELVDRVVKRVEEHVRKNPLDVVTHPTGLNENLEDFEKVVELKQQRDSRQGKIVGIVGPGGVGKTTFAVEFFNRKSSDFKKSCFLFDVREVAARSALHSLQKQIIKDLSSWDPDITNTADGRGRLSHYLSFVPALIVLDNVDDVKQLRAFFSPQKDAALHSGSLILVTSRYKDVLIESGISESSIYEVKGLNREHSEELFCLHAFHKSLPSEGFEEMVTKFLSVCDGLPLSLEVIGGLLYEKKLKFWESQLCKIGRGLPTDIQIRLKISYESLDKEEKDLFLDIACFFINENKDVAITVWDAFGRGSGWLNLENLKNKYLVKIDTQNCIRMHDHLRDLGRELAKEEPPRGHLRLWRPTDNLHDVPNGSIVRGMNMVESSGQSLYSRVEPGAETIDMTKLQLLKAEGDCLESKRNLLRHSDLLWLCWNNYPYTFLPSWIPIRNLRVLQVTGGKLETLWQFESEAPLELRELKIGADLVRFPKSIGLLEHLERIEMKEVIKPLPEEFFQLRSLKHLCLRTRMIWFPDFENLTKLQHIDLSGSKDLQTLPPSFGKLIQLTHLSLAGCPNLTISGETFGKIDTLESLDLSGCLKMEILPLQVTHQRSLIQLNLLRTSLKELPNAIGCLINLKILKLQSPALKMLPSSLGHLTSLTELSLLYCNNLQCLPDSVGELKLLRTLMIHRARIKSLPAGVTQLKNLEKLDVIYCPLSEVPFSSEALEVGGGKEALTDLREHGMLFCSNDKCMLRLKHLDLHGTKIKELSFPQGVCPDLQHLNLSFCVELVKVGTLPSKLISLHLQECHALKNITGLYGLEKLKLLDISGCNQLEELLGLETLTSLEELRGR